MGDEGELGAIYLQTSARRGDSAPALGATAPSEDARRPERSRIRSGRCAPTRRRGVLPRRPGGARPASRARGLRRKSSGRGRPALSPPSGGAAQGSALGAPQGWLSARAPDPALEAAATGRRTRSGHRRSDPEAPARRVRDAHPGQGRIHRTGESCARPGRALCADDLFPPTHRVHRGWFGAWIRTRRAEPGRSPGPSRQGVAGRALELGSRAGPGRAAGRSPGFLSLSPRRSDCTPALSRSQPLPEGE